MEGGSVVLGQGNRRLDRHAVVQGLLVESRALEDEVTTGEIRLDLQLVVGDTEKALLVVQL